MRRFLTRFPEGGGQLIPPPPMTGLLFWADVGSISPTPANGASVTTIPVFPGTPTTQNGINVSLIGTFGGGFPGKYVARQMPSGAGAVDMRGGQLAHTGGAFTIYLDNSGGGNAGLTIYQRLFFYTGILNNSRNLWTAPAGANGASSGFAAQTDVNQYTLLTGGGVLGFTTGGIVGSNTAHTIATVLPHSGMYTVYLDGTPVQSAASGEVAIETNNSGDGIIIGQGDNTSTYAISSILGYQATHSQQQVALISNWLRINR